MLALTTLTLTACTTTPAVQTPLTLPIAHSNNAVAIATSADGPTLYSFNGLRGGKAHTDVSRQAFACPVQTACRQLADVPVPEGRLASSAVTLNNTIYLFGGYSVAADGTEVSTPQVLAFDPLTETYTKHPDMPVPVDDAVIFTHAERYIYLVSGWHDDGNVSHVQVYDTQTQIWARATDYPGAPVFGHSGGAVGGNIVIADGVAVIGRENGRRQFGAVSEAWLGEIAPSDHLSIRWSHLPHTPVAPLYRMAATGHKTRNQVIFAGGGDNPYNINGVGYDGENAVPSAAIFAFDLATKTWIDLGTLPTASMDHRGLLTDGNTAYIIGGMDADLNVRDAITKFELGAEPK